jgi:hypothetical protein
MELHDFAFFFAIATGLVSAGIMGSIWTLISGKELRPALPRQVGVDTTLKTFAIAVNAPLAMVRMGLWYTTYNPVMALFIIVAGLGWSFFQGVFILTQLFGLK